MHSCKNFEGNNSFDFTSPVQYMIYFIYNFIIREFLDSSKYNILAMTTVIFKQQEKRFIFSIRSCNELKCHLHKCHDPFHYLFFSTLRSFPLFLFRSIVREPGFFAHCIFWWFVFKRFSPPLFLLAGVLVDVKFKHFITDWFLYIVSSPSENSSSIGADIEGSSATLEMIDDEKLVSFSTEDSSIVTFDRFCLFRKYSE